MKKTKEIDVWIGTKFTDDITDDRCLELNHVICLEKKAGTTKARLIIELPEKKIEISESQFNNAFDNHKEYNLHDFKENLRRTLGFKC